MSVTLHNYVQWWKPTSHMPVFINMLDSTLTPTLPPDSFSLLYLYEISQRWNIQHVFCMAGFHKKNHTKQKQLSWQIKRKHTVLQCSSCITNSSKLHKYFQFRFAVDKSHNLTKSILCYTTEYLAASRDKMKHIFISVLEY
jgi:hypothetical protein